MFTESLANTYTRELLHAPYTTRAQVSYGVSMVLSTVRRTPFALSILESSRMSVTCITATSTAHESFMHAHLRELQVFSLARMLLRNNMMAALSTYTHAHALQRKHMRIKANKPHRTLLASACMVAEMYVRANKNMRAYTHMPHHTFRLR